MALFLKKVSIFIFLLIIVNPLCSNEKKTLNFAPLPTKKTSKNIEDFSAINSYLQEELSIDIKYIYKKDYQDILDGFKNGTIDIAYLGPLPFVKLKNEYKFVKPIITFKQENGLSGNRCVLAKFKNDVFDKNKRIKVALTQPLSTCGYLMVNVMLRDNFNMKLKDQAYDYKMSHTNALISVVKGEFLIAGANEKVAKAYESLGMEIIARSELLPGSSLVLNTKTLSKKQIESIEKILWELPQSTYKSWQGITSDGVEKANIHDYDGFNIDLDIPKKGNMK
ncbi:MAG: phosphonate transport system substrate-binding protein [Sulfurimonas sp.]|jgi:phosphonate transport system substrate-binding protein